MGIEDGNLWCVVDGRVWWLWASMGKTPSENQENTKRQPTMEQIKIRYQTNPNSWMMVSFKRWVLIDSLGRFVELEGVFHGGIGSLAFSHQRKTLKASEVTQAQSWDSGNHGKTFKHIMKPCFVLIKNSTLCFSELGALANLQLRANRRRCTGIRKTFFQKRRHAAAERFSNDEGA